MEDYDINKIKLSSACSATEKFIYFPFNVLAIQEETGSAAQADMLWNKQISEHQGKAMT